jgi:hypothetical protein
MSVMRSIRGIIRSERGDWGVTKSQSSWIMVIVGVLVGLFLLGGSYAEVAKGAAGMTEYGLNAAILLTTAVGYSVGYLPSNFVKARNLLLTSALFIWGAASVTILIGSVLLMGEFPSPWEMFLLKRNLMFLGFLTYASTGLLGLVVRDCIVGGKFEVQRPYDDQTT